MKQRVRLKHFVNDLATSKMELPLRPAHKWKPLAAAKKALPQM